MRRMVGASLLVALVSGVLAQARDPSRADSSGPENPRRHGAFSGAETGPFLFTERLVLRALELEDAWGMRGILADPDPRCRCGEAHAPTLEETRRRLARLIEQHDRSGGLGLWAVREKRTGGILGVCGLCPVEGTGPEVELFYQLKLPPWCKHYAAESIGECLRHGFEGLGLERVVAVMDPDDPICARTLGMLEKAGMSYRGTRRLYGRELFIYEATGGANR